MFRRPLLTMAVVFLLLFAIACSQTQLQQAADATPDQSTQVPQTASAPAAPPNQPPSPASPAPFTDVDETPRAAQVNLQPNGQELPTVEVVELLTPSVVQVVTETLTMGFFTQPIPSQGVGTGVILDTEGHILTNNHVISGAQGINVTVDRGESFPAEVIGQDPSTDLAIIKIDAENLQPARLGNSSELRVGEDVIAIGHALGLPGGPTVSKGVVSALGRTIDTDSQNTIVDLIQTDSEINPGNSGGPLVNNRAEVVGINTAIIQSGRGIGFAININDAKVVMQQLIVKGFVDRGFLGVTPVNMTPGIANRFGFPVTEGIILARVIRGSAAESGGLIAEDIIVEMDSEPIRNNGELSKFLITHPPGETIEVTFFRNGEMQTTEVTLGSRPR